TTTTTAPTTTTTAPTTTTTAPTTTTTRPDAGYNLQGACPVDEPNTFVDTWGAPRSGGRTHQGVDILAARGTAVRAIHEGILFRVDRGGLGGLFIWLRSLWGDEYYYAHLNDFGPGIRTGIQVDQGDLIGYVGTTGNSPANVPHLHFEYHPGGGRAVNPYELAVTACE
ncbi:MAG: M23 family metallopeptidase, partial [Actinomycetia bacterium]|nr:M23 family metallopeptidase [Actinomycetes bacterium]